MTAIDFESVNSAEDVAAVMRAMYGGDLSRVGGVVHVAAVWRDMGKRLITMRINAQTPKSTHDYFVLNLARARADAIITSGRVLREEPELTHEIAGPTGSGAALESWRREVAKKSKPPVSLVLTSGRDLDLHHPIFRGPGATVLFTNPEAAASLGAKNVGSSIRIVGRSDVGPRAAVRFLSGECGAETVSIELGPSSARALYGHPSQVDELLLSILDAPRIPRTVVGPDFIDAATLDRVLSNRSSPFRVRDGTDSDTWSFTRHTR